MNQKKLINLYNRNLNSMFDDSESEEEIKDSANDSHDKLNELSKKENPVLFDCIISMMRANNLPHQKDNQLTFKELNQIKIIYKPVLWCGSYFSILNPPNGDFSIIFKYLRNIEIIEENAFYGCLNLLKIKFPDTIKRIYNNVFDKCKNIEEIEIPKSIEILDLNFLNSWDYLDIKKLILPKKFKNDMDDFLFNRHCLKKENVSKNIIYI